jgi:glucose-1-phosphate adenylyltransferase
MQKKETIALLLAGGQGSRLGILTQTIAKPAVLYGGKFRIIDFSLSNCANSGIDTVGVLTQYLPHKLTSHVGIGKAWDLDRVSGGLSILGPYLRESVGEWYKNTANAVYQNIQFVDEYDPEYVVILSGDHIYKMDYSEMIEFHKSKNADATISVINVSLDEASRYGIMNADEENRIYEFEEKPKEPKSTLASMGVYVFNWKVLRDCLIRDNEDPYSKNDFGGNIVPMMISEQRQVYAYRFDGYWKDVGTIQAYWESNMDLVNRMPEFNLYDPKWKIFTPSMKKAPNFVGSEGEIKRSIVAEGCINLGKVKNSVIFPGVHVEEGVEIEDSIIMTGVKVGKNSKISQAIVGEEVEVGSGVVIGRGTNLENKLMPHIYNSGITVIGEGAKIPDRASLGKNVMVDVFVEHEDFKSIEIASGESVLKGGA